MKGNVLSIIDPRKFIRMAKTEKVEMLPGSRITHVSITYRGNIIQNIQLEEAWLLIFEKPKHSCPV